MTWLSWPIRNVVATNRDRAVHFAPLTRSLQWSYASTLRSSVDTLVLADYARHTGADIPAESNGGAIA